MLRVAIFSAFAYLEVQPCLGVASWREGVYSCCALTDMNSMDIETVEAAGTRDAGGGSCCIAEYNFSCIADTGSEQWETLN